MRLKRKRKKNHSHFHLESLGYVSASRTHAAASRSDWTRSPRRKLRPRQNEVITSAPVTEPTAPVEAKVFVAVPPTSRPSANASAAADARMRGCTKSANAWRAS
jgi:hypothetical protein